MKPPLFLPLAALLWLSSTGAVGAPSGSRFFPDSVVAVSPVSGAGPAIVRRELSAGERAGLMTFSVNLKMRDFAGLQQRLAAGEQISQPEMEAEYLPLATDYARIAAWLAAQGFIPVVSDRNHTTLVVQGTADQVARAFGVTLARVTVPARGASPITEYTSAITAPSLPADLAEPVLGIDGLQPHLRLRHTQVEVRPLDVVQGAADLTPDNVAAAYGIASTWTGKGQTIAILDEASTPSTDFNTFWSTIGVSQSSANVTTVSIGGGIASSGTGSSETALDIEWAGALAPDAQLRLYLASNVINLLPQVLNDLPSHPGLSVVSISFGAPENGQAVASILATSQAFAQLAAAGVSVFVSSGDGGSNPVSGTGPTAGFYSASSPTLPEYPASDPNVTGVGGTTLAMNASFVPTGETTWNFIASQPTQPVASGGGISSISNFTAPSWQTGTPSPSRRCVPDVSASAAGSIPAGNVGALIVVGGALKNVIGTSLACPIWGAVAAQLNQARSTAGLSPAGLLGPRIYPLAGTAAFTDITSGSNGAFSAGPGYDLCTGLGTPNVKNLIVALGGVVPPTITSQPTSVVTTTGTLFQFSVTASGGGSLSYQWLLNGTALAGANGTSYVKGAATATDVGSYTVTVSNVAGSVTSSAATLTVNAPTPPPAPASSGGGGGGGGAPSLWFYGALLLLGGARQATRRLSA
jgi:kumamolisin